MDPGIISMAERIAQSSGVALVLSLVFNILLLSAVRKLYRENQDLHKKMEKFLEIILPWIRREP